MSCLTVGGGRETDTLFDNHQGILKSRMFPKINTDLDDLCIVIWMSLLVISPPRLQKEARYRKVKRT